MREFLAALAQVTDAAFAASIGLPDTARVVHQGLVWAVEPSRLCNQVRLVRSDRRILMNAGYFNDLRGRGSIRPTAVEMEEVPL